MTIYLRDKINKTLLDVEVWEAMDEGKEYIEVSSSVPIKEYSQLLLSNPDKTDYIVEQFSNLDFLRGWYWEVWKDKNPNHTLNDLVKVIMLEFLEPICKELNLHIVTD